MLFSPCLLAAYSMNLLFSYDYLSHIIVAVGWSGLERKCRTHTLNMLAWGDRGSSAWYQSVNS